MARGKEDPRWGIAERARLGVALKRAGHTQAEFVAELVESYGIEPVKQGTASRWISGGIATPACIEALLAYCDRYAPEADGSDVGQPSGASSDLPGAGSAQKLTVVRSGESVSDSQHDPSMSGPASGWQHVREFASRLDEVRAELRRERERSRALARDLARVAREVEEALESADRIDDVAETYSRALKDGLG